MKKVYIRPNSVVYNLRIEQILLSSSHDCHNLRFTGLEDDEFEYDGEGDGSDAW